MAVKITSHCEIAKTTVIYHLSLRTANFSFLDPSLTMVNSETGIHIIAAWSQFNINEAGISSMSTSDLLSNKIVLSALLNH